MAIQDIANDVKVILAQKDTIASNTTTQGVSIDTANFETGLMLTMLVYSRTDGTYALSAEESDDDSVWTNVASDNYTCTPVTASAATAEGGSLVKLGLFGTKRYVRSEVTSTLVTTGAGVIVVATLGAEIMPQA